MPVSSFKGVPGERNNLTSEGPVYSCDAAVYRVLDDSEIFTWVLCNDFCDWSVFFCWDRMYGFLKSLCTFLIRALDFYLYIIFL